MGDRQQEVKQRGGDKKAVQMNRVMEATVPPGRSVLVPAGEKEVRKAKGNQGR